MSITQYIRRGNKLVGCFYAEKSNYLDCFEVGFSLCKKTDKFDKSLGHSIALNRAIYNRGPEIPVSIRKDYILFLNRCAKYYKVKKFSISGSIFILCEKTDDDSEKGQKCYRQL